MKIETLVRKVLLEIEQDSKETTQKDASKGPNLPSPEYSLSNDELNKLLSSKEQTESEISVNKKELPEQNVPGQNTDGGDDESEYDVDEEPPATDNVDNEQYEVEEDAEDYAICESGDSGGCDVYFKKGNKVYFTIGEIKQNNIPVQPETYVYVYSTKQYTQAGRIKAFVDSDLVMRLGPDVRDPNAWINSFPECVREFNQDVKNKRYYTNQDAIQDENGNLYQVIFTTTKRQDGLLAVAISSEKRVSLKYSCEGGELAMTDINGLKYYEIGLQQEEPTTTFVTEANAIFKINEYLGIKFLCETEANCIGIFIDKNKYELNENALESLNEHFIKQINGAYRGDSIGQYCELVRHLVEVYKILSNKYPTYEPYSYALQVAEETKKQLDDAIAKSQQFITTVPGMKNNLSSWNIKTSPTSEAEKSLYNGYQTETTPYLKNVFTIYKPKSVGVGSTEKTIERGTERIKTGKITKKQCKQQLYNLARLSGLGGLEKYMSADAEFQQNASFFDKIFKEKYATRGGEGAEGIEEIKQDVKACYDAGIYKGKWYDLYNRFFGPGRTNKINPNAETAQGQVTSTTTTIYKY